MNILHLEHLFNTCENDTTCFIFPTIAQLATEPSINLVCQLQWIPNHISWNFDLSRGPIQVEWYKGAETNICYNCLDRNVKLGLGSSTCFLWEGNEPRAPPAVHAHMHAFTPPPARVHSLAHPPPAKSGGGVRCAPWLQVRYVASAAAAAPAAAAVTRAPDAPPPRVRVCLPPLSHPHSGEPTINDSARGSAHGLNTHACMHSLAAAGGYRGAERRRARCAGDSAVWTYAQALREVCRMAGWLRALGVQPGDAVAVYMPMVPQLPMAMVRRTCSCAHACTRPL